MAGSSPLSFLRESFRNFRTTGAIAPSSRFLARGMARQIPERIGDDFRVIEVGAGTGAITAELARRMNGRGTLDCWELSPDLAAVLRQRVATEPVFEPQRGRLNVQAGNILDLKPAKPYNAIVSGLPFNCFQPDEVERFLEHFKTLLVPDGSLVWFEYVAIRELQRPFVSRTRREQLRGISEVTGRYIRQHQTNQEIVPINLPPARVRHLRFV